MNDRRIAPRTAPRAPTNADIMAALREVNDRLDKQEQKLTALGGVEQAAATLVRVAETWKLATLGGNIVKWLASVLAAIGVIWVFFNGGPKQ